MGQKSQISKSDTLPISMLRYLFWCDRPKILPFGRLAGSPPRLADPRRPENFSRLTRRQLKQRIYAAANSHRRAWKDGGGKDGLQLNATRVSRMVWETRIA